MLNSKNIVSLHRFSKEEYFSKKFGEVVEWSITAVLKTAERRRSGGSNPSLSAKKSNQIMVALFLFMATNFFLNTFVVLVCDIKECNL